MTVVYIAWEFTESSMEIWPVSRQLSILLLTGAVGRMVEEVMGGGAGGCREGVEER